MSRMGFGIVPRMPKKNLDPHLVHFSQLLREALHAASMEDPAYIGVRVAQLQEHPPREDLAYHPAVVKAWMDGRALPNEAAFATLHELLADKVSPAFEDAYDLASLHHQSVQEISLVLQARYKEHGYTLKKLCAALAEHGITNHHGGVLSPASIANFFVGTSALPSRMIPALDLILPPFAHEASLGQLYYHEHPSPEVLLQRATETTDIHRALRYIRRALGFSCQEMAQAVNAQLPPHSKTSHVKIHNWETLAHKNNSALPSRHSFPDTDPITVYTQILTDHGYGEWARNNDNHLRDILTEAIDHRRAESLRLQPYALPRAQQPVATAVSR